MLPVPAPGFIGACTQNAPSDTLLTMRFSYKHHPKSHTCSKCGATMKVKTGVRVNPIWLLVGVALVPVAALLLTIRFAGWLGSIVLLFIAFLVSFRLTRTWKCGTCGHIMPMAVDESREPLPPPDTMGRRK